MKDSLKISKYGFISGMNNNEKEVGWRAFDWDKAAQLIKDAFKLHPDVKAEAGLQKDWEYTGGVIFQDGEPVTDSYTYLASAWAQPTLILSWDGEEQQEIDCSTTDRKSRFNSGTCWDEESKAILNE